MPSNPRRQLVFYRSLKTFFENGAAAFGPPSRAEKQVEERERRIAFLEAKLKRKDEVLAELMEERVALKKPWGNLKEQWVAHDTRDQVINLVDCGSGETEITVCVLILWLGLATSKFYRWQTRYGNVNEHNA